jgi:hypothetical protein
MCLGHSRNLKRRRKQELGPWRKEDILSTG